MQQNTPDSLEIPNELLKEIDKILPSDDLLDAIDFNEIEYINQLFPTEQSLVNIDEVISKFEENIKVLDREIKDSLHEQLKVEKEGLKTLEKAKGYIKDLAIQIEDIKCKAETSENMVNEITQDIRQLDQAKQNLTLSITTLNHLHMLVGGVESLEKLIPQRKYGEISNLLQGLLNVLDQFKDCMDIPQIKEMANKVYGLRKQAGDQIFLDFKTTLGGQSGPRVLTNTHDLYEAVKVVDIMDQNYKKEFLDWFINLQLTEYNLLFQETQDEGWLDRIEKRFTWFKRFANEFTEKYYGVFPDSWHMLHKIALEFCHLTRNHLTKAMTVRNSEIDVKLLLFAIQKTTAFEGLLAEKFTIPEDDTKEEHVGEIKLEPSDSDTKNPFYEPPLTPITPLPKSPSKQLKEDKPKISPFKAVISKCFEEHMEVFIKAQDRNLRDMLERFVKDTKQLVTDLTVNATQPAGTTSAYEPMPDNKNVNSNMIVLPSSADLFVFYKSCLIQSTQLDNPGFLVSLANEVFKPHLRAYAQRVLTAHLPNNINNPSSTSSAASNLRELASFLKEGPTKFLSKGDIHVLCLIIGTSEYCCETIKQLETKMKEKIDPTQAANIDFNDEVDLFQGIISTSINSLIQDLESQCEPLLSIMAKTNWLICETVGDQSKYVTGLINCFKSYVPLVRDNLTESRKYFTQFCTRFVNSFIPRFITALYKCKAVGMVGAEQLLLDTHSLKTVLLEFPSLSSQLSSANGKNGSSTNPFSSSGNSTKKPPPASFTKVVVKGMTRAEMILKVVMTPHQDSIPMFVENCLKLIPDLEAGEFQKILDIKGVKRNDQYAITECFREHRNKVTEQYAKILGNT